MGLVVWNGVIEGSWGFPLEESCKEITVSLMVSRADGVIVQLRGHPCVYVCICVCVCVESSGLYSSADMLHGQDLVSGFTQHADSAFLPVSVWQQTNPPNMLTPYVTTRHADVPVSTPTLPSCTCPTIQLSGEKTPPTAGKSPATATRQHRSTTIPAGGHTASNE